MKIAALLRENVDAFGKLDTLDHGTPTQRADIFCLRRRRIILNGQLITPVR